MAGGPFLPSGFVVKRKCCWGGLTGGETSKDLPSDDTCGVTFTSMMVPQTKMLTEDNGDRSVFQISERAVDFKTLKKRKRLLFRTKMPKKKRDQHPRQIRCTAMSALEKNY